MSRAIFSAVSGLTSEQFTMDVIGNNIANVNTVGFKNSRANLESTFSQEVAAASAQNPVGTSVGLGTLVSGTQTLFTQGAFQNTGVNTDIALSGSGWLITEGGLGSVPLATSPSPTSGGLYTRAGNLVLDAQGYLRTVNGNFVYGAMAGGTNAALNSTFNTSVPTSGYYIADTNSFSLNSSQVSIMSANTGAGTLAGAFTAVRIPQYIAAGTSQELVSTFSVGTDGAVTVVSDEGTTRVIGFATVAHFTNDTGLQAEGNNNYIATAASGAPIFFQPGVGPAGETRGGALELSNVDLSTEFSNMIITQQGYDANAKTITTAQQMLQAIINVIQ